MTTNETSGTFRTFVEQFEIPVFVIDGSGTFEYVSPELGERIHAETDAEGECALLGQDVTEYVDDGDADTLREVLAGRAGNGREIVRFEGWDDDSRFEILDVDDSFVGCPHSVSVLESGRTRDEPGEVVRVLEQLHGVTNRLYRAESIVEGLDIVIEAAVEVLGFDWCLLAEATDGVFEIRAISSDSPLNVGENPLATDEGVAGAVYQSGESQLTHDVTCSDEARPTHNFISSMITVPVGSWGVFQAHSKTEEAFDEQDQQLAETLVAPLATMIERVQRETQLRESNEAHDRQRRQIEALHTVATRMKTTARRTDVYDMAIEAVEEILEFDICLIDEAEGDVLVPKAVGSNMSVDDYYAETPIDEPDNLGSLTYRRGETLVVDDLQEAGFAPARSRYTSAISLALDDWGVFQIVSEEEAAFDQTDQRLIELLAEHAVAAIDRIDRERQLERRARELEAQNARLDEFASIVSHDLRNPLNVAMLRTEHAKRVHDVDSLESVEDALDRMETIVDNVLTLARQGESIDPGRVDLQDITDRCWGQVPAEEGTVTVSGNLAVEADEDRLGHLFENLFRNSVEHATGDVSIEVGPLPDGQGFYVEDDGPGIDEDARDQVFERGYTESESGTGLGLAIVEEIVEAHDWEIRVTEGDFGGARFEITDVTVPQ